MKADKPSASKLFLRLQKLQDHTLGSYKKTFNKKHNIGAVLRNTRIKSNGKANSFFFLFVFVVFVFYYGYLQSH